MKEVFDYLIKIKNNEIGAAYRFRQDLSSLQWERIA